jgi:tryptophan-rich sensory protein
VKPLLIALGTCALAALLEGVAAGPGVRERLSSLRAPRWALSFGGWVVVGALYYVLCFAVLLRLLNLPSTALTSAALATLVTLMAANAGFNFIFFRRRNLHASFLFFLPYSAIAVALFAQLLFVDRLAAAVFGPYLLYFVYATAWGYELWRLNPHAGNGG